jgi:CheY-like chemotaxis protein
VKEYEEVPPVDANEARLGQVFLNLMVNAAQAIPEGDAENNVIEVSLRVDASGRVVVGVCDSGSGIPPENLGRLFDAFFTTKPIGVGTGLGLPICHRIVSGLGGEIRVESQVGKGSTFSVLLPRSAAPLAPEVAAPSHQVPRRGRVLVVDDEPAISRTVARSLQHVHDVETTGDAADALARITRGERYDVIVCDVMMPQTDGFDVLSAVRQNEKTAAIPFIFLTAQTERSFMRMGMEMGADDYMTKPFTTEELRRAVKARLVRQAIIKQSN